MDLSTLRNIVCIVGNQFGGVRVLGQDGTAYTRVEPWLHLCWFGFVSSENSQQRLALSPFLNVNLLSQIMERK